MSDDESETVRTWQLRTNDGKWKTIDRHHAMSLLSRRYADGSEFDRTRLRSRTITYGEWKLASDD